MTDRARNGRGRFVRTTDSAKRDARAAELRSQGRTLQAIADELGYSDRGEAWRGIQRALVAIVREPAEKLQAIEAARLDELYVAALDVLERDHVMVSHGKVITADDPETGKHTPLLDDGPRLAALRELRQIRESYRKLYGLDAPQRLEYTGEVTAEDLLRLVNAAPDQPADDGTEGEGRGADR